MNGNCDFCGKDKKLYEATIVSSDESNKIKSIKFKNPSGQIAKVYRCARCMFWQIMKDVIPFWLLIITIWILLLLDNDMFIPIAMLITFLLYKPFLTYIKNNVQLKSNIDLMKEKGILFEKHPNDQLLQDSFIIQNDTRRLIIIIFGTFLLPVFFLFPLKVISNKNQEASFAIHKRLGVGYLRGDENHLNYDKHQINLSTQINIKNSGDADTLYQYFGYFYSLFGDSCEYGYFT